MAEAGLLVERGSIRDTSEDWGVHEFVCLPSPGDRIAAEHEGTVHYLTVICIHHRPVARRSDAGARERAPTAAVVARWTGED